MDREFFLRMAARQDKLLAEADRMLADPRYAEMRPLAQEIRELMIDFQAMVKEKLDAEG